MINVNKLRNGTAFELEGEKFLVQKYEFSKIGRGKADIKVKCKNLKTGAVVNKTFTSGNSVQEISLIRKKRQFLYQDADKCVFMDPTSFEQVEIDLSTIGDQAKFLKEGGEVLVLYSGGEALGIELAAKVKLKVAETGPGEKGNSATNIFKPAVMENGVAVKVPLFIKPGEVIVVDTRTGEYLSRA